MGTTGRRMEADVARALRRANASAEIGRMEPEELLKRVAELPLLRDQFAEIRSQKQRVREALVARLAVVAKEAQPGLLELARKRDAALAAVTQAEEALTRAREAANSAVAAVSRAEGIARGEASSIEMQLEQTADPLIDTFIERLDREFQAAHADHFVTSIGEPTPVISESLSGEKDRFVPAPLGKAHKAMAAARLEQHERLVRHLASIGAPFTDLERLGETVRIERGDVGTLFRVEVSLRERIEAEAASVYEQKNAYMTGLTAAKSLAAALKLTALADDELRMTLELIESWIPYRAPLPRALPEASAARMQ